MVIALFALALAMIVGGSVAIVQGWDIVQVERGWSLVIAGTVGAAGGALLLGVAAAVARLSAVKSELALLRERLGRQEPTLPPAPVHDPAAASSGLLAGGGLSPGAAVELAEDDAQPTLPLFLRSEKEAEKRPEPEPRINPAAHDAAFSEGEEREAGRPMLADTQTSRPNDDLEDRDFGKTEPHRDALAETDDHDHPWLRWRPEPQLAPDREPEFAPEPDEAEPAAPGEPLAEDRSATVIGTYTSGPNRYVMFSDGSIEAETPEGVFRFGSLDELKQFIASGGEDGTPRAP